MKLLVVLQNAYDRGGLAGGWHPGRWRAEFEKSHTGKRIRHVLPAAAAGWRIHFANACPGIGEGASSKLVPCRRHLLRAIRRVRPDAVLACGAVAESLALAAWDGPLFAVPHPASRVVTHKLMARCRRSLLRWAAAPDQSAPPREAYRLERGLVRGRLVSLATLEAA